MEGNYAITTTQDDNGNQINTTVTTTASYEVETYPISPSPDYNQVDRLINQLELSEANPLPVLPVSFVDDFFNSLDNSGQNEQSQSSHAIENPAPNPTQFNNFHPQSQTVENSIPTSSPHSLLHYAYVAFMNKPPSPSPLDTVVITTTPTPTTLNLTDTVVAATTPAPTPAIPTQPARQNPYNLPPDYDQQVDQIINQLEQLSETNSRNPPPVSLVVDFFNSLNMFPTWHQNSAQSTNFEPNTNIQNSHNYSKKKEKTCRGTEGWKTWLRNKEITNTYTKNARETATAINR